MRILFFIFCLFLNFSGLFAQSKFIHFSTTFQNEDIFASAGFENKIKSPFSLQANAALGIRRALQGVIFPEIQLRGHYLFYQSSHFHPSFFIESKINYLNPNAQQRIVFQANHLGARFLLGNTWQFGTSVGAGVGFLFLNWYTKSTYISYKLELNVRYEL